MWFWWWQKSGSGNSNLTESLCSDQKKKSNFAEPLFSNLKEIRGTLKIISNGADWKAECNKKTGLNILKSIRFFIQSQKDLKMKKNDKLQVKIVDVLG